MFSPYSSVTGRVSKSKAKQDVKALERLVASYKDSRKAATLNNINRIKAQRQSALRQLRKDAKALREEQIRLERLEKDKLFAEAIKKLKNIDKQSILADKYIEDIRVVGNDIFATTSNIKFNDEDLFTDRGLNLKGVDVGRFIIMCRPANYNPANTSTIKRAVQAINLTWRYNGYSHPFISPGGRFCMGTGYGLIKKGLENLDYVQVFEAVIELLTSHHDDSPLVSWNEFLEERSKVEDSLTDGVHYWSFENGPSSVEVFYKDKEKAKKLAKYQKEIYEVLDSNQPYSRWGSDIYGAENYVQRAAHFKLAGDKDNYIYAINNYLFRYGNSKIAEELYDK